MMSLVFKIMSFVFLKISFKSNFEIDSSKHNYWIDSSNRNDLAKNLDFLYKFYTLKKINLPKFHSFSVCEKTGIEVSIFDIYLSMLALNRNSLELFSLIYLIKSYFQYVLLRDSFGNNSRVVTYLTYSIPGLLILRYLDSHSKIRITCVQHGYKTTLASPFIHLPLEAGCDEIILFDEEARGFYQYEFESREMPVPIMRVSEVNIKIKTKQIKCIENVIFIPTFSENYDPYNEIIAFCETVLDSGCIPYIKPHPRIFSGFFRKLYTYFKLRDFIGFILKDITEIESKNSLYVSNGSTLLYYKYLEGYRTAWYSSYNMKNTYLFDHVNLGNNQKLYDYLENEKCEQ